MKLVMDNDERIVKEFNSINDFLSYAWTWAGDMLAMAEVPRYSPNWWNRCVYKKVDFERAISLVGVTYKDTAYIAGQRINCKFRLINEGCPVLNGKELKLKAAQYMADIKNKDTSKYRWRASISYPEGSSFRCGPISEWDEESWDKPKTKKRDLDTDWWGGRSLDMRTARAALDPDAAEHKLVRPVMKPFGRCTDRWDDPITYWWSKNSKKNWKRDKRYRHQWEKNL